MLFQRCEQRKVADPGVFPPELFHGIRKIPVRLGETAAEKQILVGADRIIVYDFRVIRREFFRILIIQQSFLTKGPAGNEQGVAGKDGGGLIRAFPISDRPDWQDLPDSHSGGMQKVGKFIGFLPE